MAKKIKRSEFLKWGSTVGISAPFLLNGLSARAARWLEGIDLPADCGQISDRVVVIVRLAGANDGLNTVIPSAQYDLYAQIRPSLHLPASGAGSIITLDGTLSAEKACALHPALTGFKALYDSGKLSILPGVGYPAPNYSHFASENTMFAGKDGNTNQSLQDGMFGRYLASIYPNLSGNPNGQNPDPLAIHMGSSNPSLFYGHSHETGIEYNLTGLQNELWSMSGFEAGGNMTANALSEHIELLEYIQFVENSMDVYYNRVLQCFTTGSNATTTYPDTDLGRQLKTVARLIKGGSRTKVFQVTLGGFDTHVNQIVAGSSGTGNHANLLSNLSTAVQAFQQDIELLGLADQILTVTFSEFGRQVRQNANLGSDHGNISPFFVIGRQVEAGVLSAHPIIPPSGFQYAESERRYDYRQLFATLLQDWLGADDPTMQVAQLDTFATAAQKLPILKDAAIATAACYVNNLVVCNSPTETQIAVAKITENGWTWYAPADSTDNRYLLGVEHIPAGAGGNTASFVLEIDVVQKTCDPTGHPLIHRHLTTEPQTATFVGGWYINFRVLSGIPNGFVNLRFFPQATYTDALQTQASQYESEVLLAEPSTLTYIQSLLKPLNLPGDFDAAHPGIGQPFALLPVAGVGFYQGYPYIAFEKLYSLPQSGIAALRLLDASTLAAAPRTLFHFTGNGAFSNAANWAGQQVPLGVSTPYYDIFIDPAPGGRCILDIPITLGAGVRLTVANGKEMVVE